MVQFFYDRKEPRSPKDGDTEIQWVVFQDSFNPEKVVRSYEYEEGKIIVMLDDGHEEARDIPTKDEKGRPIQKRERQWVVSEIYLNEADTIRFRETFKS